MTALLYAESSAVLSWLLGEAEGAVVSRCLGDAELVVSSELTVVECIRALTRLEQDGSLSAKDATARRALLHRAARSWSMLDLAEPAWERAGRPFPVEPVRTLDALHLSLVLGAAREQPAVKVLSRDHRIRDNAAALGLAVVP